MVDGEKKPPMGYIYAAMDRAKEAIAKNFKGKKEKYEKVFEMIDKRWDCIYINQQHVISSIQLFIMHIILMFVVRKWKLDCTNASQIWFETVLFKT